MYGLFFSDTNSFPLDCSVTSLIKLKEEGLLHFYFALYLFLTPFLPLSFSFPPIFHLLSIQPMLQRNRLLLTEIYTNDIQKMA